MKKRNPLGWSSRTILSGSHAIVVSRRDEQTEWDDIALSYWQGGLADLQRVTSSKNAEVLLGISPHNGKRYYFKRFLQRKNADFFKQLLFASRARKALLNGLSLEQHGFSVARSVCLVEQPAYGSIKESALITEALSDCHSVKDLLRLPQFGIANNVIEKRKFMQSLAQSVGELHRAGFYHGDLNAGNIYSSVEGGFQFYFLDNERTKKFKTLPEHLRIHNLKQLNKMQRSISRTDRLRIWQKYQTVAEIDDAGGQQIISQVIKLTARDWERGRGM